ncbi:hypothetical protein J2P12_06170, partial [Candidatus Bathyarchaeota archaeon]|nr:hypothetical protein [Candidatus Bathyarchaeota archaeon]
MSKANRCARLVKRAGWLVGVRAFLALITVVFASSITASTITYQADLASSFNITNSLHAVDKGFYIAAGGLNSTGASCSTPVTFAASPGVANTDITSRHLVYDVQVNSTSAGTPNRAFNVTFILGSIAYGPLCIRDSAAPI